jgi:hypothetical protein
VSFLVNQDDHPYANRPRRAKQRCAVDPAGPALFKRLFDGRNGLRQPADLGSHATCGVSEGVANGRANTVIAADAF